MCARDFKVDVEHEGERARDDDLILRQLGHGDVQGLARVGLRGVEGDALHSPLGLHSAEHFLRVRRVQACGHGHHRGIHICFVVVSKFEIAKHLCIPLCIMAEGGFDPLDPTNEETPLIPGGDDDDDEEWMNLDLQTIPAENVDDEEEWQPPNPFDPNPSAPQGGEEIAMSTRLPPEKQGAQGGTAETSFITGFDKGVPTQDAFVRRELEDIFPKLSLTELEFRYREAPRSGGSVIEVKYHTSKKWDPLFTKSRGDTEKTINRALPKRVLEALGPYNTDLVAETNADLDRLNQQAKAQEAQFQQAETKAERAQRLRQERAVIKGRRQDNTARIQEMENAPGPLDTKAIQRLKNEDARLATDYEGKGKELLALAGEAKEAQQAQQALNKTRLKQRVRIKQAGQLKAMQDDVLPNDELEEKAKRLEERKEELQRIIEDENTSPSAKEAAEQTLAEINEQLEIDRENLAARERQKPLLERIKDIFKKYGWTLQAVALAAGVVLSALALARLNGLKAGTKAVGQGLKAVGKKLGSLLPGLIGSIVSFIFKAAGQVFSFLAEHAWLLILAVVAFFMERMLKRKSK